MIIVCMRDPDASNDFVVFAEGQPEPQIIDVDYGYADLYDKDEFKGWADGHLAQAKTLEKLGTPNAVKAAEFIRGLVEEARQAYRQS